LLPVASKTLAGLTSSLALCVRPPSVPRRTGVCM
jgi:hypothetical protein